MACLTQLKGSEAKLLLERFGLEFHSLVALEQGSVNSNFLIETNGGRYFARIYEEQPLAGALAEMQLIRKLTDLGVPTPAPLQASGADPVLASGKPFALYPWVEGEILCYGLVTPAHLTELGRALGRLHNATGVLGVLPRGRFEPSDLHLRLDGIANSLNPSAHELKDAVAEIRRLLVHYVQARNDALPRGIIHGDLFRDNTLWSGTKLAAVIDFESASEGTFAYDLMVCVHAWCFADAFDVQRVRALLQGYLAERVLSPDEIRSLPGEGALAALRFATTRISDFSLRAAPGESPKRDYRRFLLRLRQLEAGSLTALFSEMGG